MACPGDWLGLGGLLHISLALIREVNFLILLDQVESRFHIDDPVGIVPIHLTSSIWGMIAVGIFCEKDKYLVEKDSFSP